MLSPVPDVLLQSKDFIPLPILPLWNTGRAIPRCIILEGGTEEERYLAAIQLLNSYKCARYGIAGNSMLPQDIQAKQSCRCFSCNHVPQYIQFKDEYCQMDKKYMQEKGGLYTFADIFFFYAPYALYLQQIHTLKQSIGNQSRSPGHAVLFCEIYTSFSAKEIYNALLKLLEEPKGDILFIMTAPERHLLLNTIISRSWVLTLPWKHSLTVTKQADVYTAFCTMLLSKTGYFSATHSFTVQDCALILTECARAIARSYYKGNAGMLEEYLSTLSTNALHTCINTVQEAQLALLNNVNPNLILHNLYVSLYQMLHKS